VQRYLRLSTLDASNYATSVRRCDGVANVADLSPRTAPDTGSACILLVTDNVMAVCSNVQCFALLRAVTSSFNRLRTISVAVANIGHCQRNDRGVDQTILD
jgi:hypothetical protein